MSGTHTTAAEKKKMLAWYRQGLTLSDVARLSERSITTVRRQLLAEGIRLRPSFDDIAPEKVRELYDEQRLSIRAVAKELAVSYGLAQRLVTTHATVRPPGDTRRPRAAA